MAPTSAGFSGLSLNDEIGINKNIPEISAAQLDNIKRGLNLAPVAGRSFEIS